MFPLPQVTAIAVQNAALVAKRVAALEKKKRTAQTIADVRGFADSYASSTRSSASSLLSQAEADRARLAALQGEGSSTAPGDGAPSGFFSSKGLLIVGGLVAVLLILRK